MNRDADALLNAMLDNWRRWARSSPRRLRSFLGLLYLPNPDEYDKESKEWKSEARRARMPVDEMEAVKVERAILSLTRRPFDAPRLVVYHLMPGYPKDTRWGKRMHKEACWRMGFQVHQYDEMVALAMNQLKRRLGL